MKVCQDSSPAKFLENAHALLYQKEPENSLMVGLCELLASQSAPSARFFRLEEDGRTIAAAVQTTPPLTNLILTEMSSDSVKHLIADFAKSQIPIPGVFGPVATVELFVEAYQKAFQKSAQLAMAQRLYKADTTVPPSRPAEGCLQLASAADLDLVTQWFVDFCQESLPPNEHQTFEQMKSSVSDRIQKGWTWLWVKDDKPVSMVNVGRPTRNGISVSAVYTPHPLRRQGYAASAVWKITEEFLNRGKKFCVLFTDLKNPTSNAIYQSVGYRPLMDTKYYLFS